MFPQVESQGQSRRQGSGRGQLLPKSPTQKQLPSGTSSSRYASGGAVSFDPSEKTLLKVARRLNLLVHRYEDLDEVQSGQGPGTSGTRSKMQANATRLGAAELAGQKLCQLFSSLLAVHVR